MIPTLRKELATVYACVGKRRRFTQRDAYLAAADWAIEERLSAICVSHDGHCGCQVFLDCKYHDEPYRSRLAKRLARWLSWRDSVIAPVPAPLPTTKRAMQKRMRELRDMMATLEHEAVRIDAAMQATVSVVL